jgi:hypothetical protein
MLVMGVFCTSVANAGAGIGVTVGTGPDDYISRGADLTLWSGDGVLNAGVSYRESESGDSAANDTEETHATLGLQLESGVGLSANYTFNDESTLEIETLGAGVSLPLDKAQTTRLFLDYRASTYTGKGILHRQLDRDEYAIGLSHSLSDRFSIGASYSDYHYSPDPSAPFVTLFQQRRQRPLAADSILFDLLDYAWTVNADWRMTERQTLGLFYNRAYNLFGELSSVTTVSDRVVVGEQWSIDLSASRIVESGSSESDYYYDLGLHYYFD